MEENISKALCESVKKRPEKTALIFYGKEFKFKDMLNEALRYAFLFHVSGIKPGDRVALMMTNVPQFVFSYYGAILAGAIVVPVNLLNLKQNYKHISEVKIPDEAKAQIKDSQPKIIIAFDFFYPLLSQIRDELEKNETRIVLTGVQDYLPCPLNKLYPVVAKKQGNWIDKKSIPKKDIFFLKNLLHIVKKQGTPNPIWFCWGFHNKPDGVAVLQYTGGTTGIPKGAMLTHRNLLSNIEQCREHMGDYVKDDYTSTLGVLPFFHVYGMTAAMNMSLLSIGAPLVLVPNAKDIKKWVGWIKKYQIKGVPSVPRLFQALGANPKLATKKNFQSVELFMNGGGALPRLAREKFENLSGAKIFEGYGLSETSPVVSVCTPEERKEGSAGKPLPDTKIKIIDLDAGTEILPGTKEGNNYKVGEIAVSGPQVMKGYWQKPNETTDVLKDGWLCTGDIGYIDSDGFLFITDRKKDMVKILGENVYPVRIEEVMASHPYIEEIAVVGVIDMAKGDKVVALVVLSEKGRNDKESAVKEILDFAKQKLSRYEVPREIIIVQTLDEYKNNLGKVLKKNIREDILKGVLK